MPIIYLVPGQETGDFEKPMDAERLLRCLGVTGRLVGFRYTIYMVECVCNEPEQIQLITKRLYPDTARLFKVSAASVERNLRTVVRTCWRQPDHSFLDQIAGVTLYRQPTNTEFIDMLASFLRRIG